MVAPTLLRNVWEYPKRRHNLADLSHGQKSLYRRRVSRILVALVSRMLFFVEGIGRLYGDLRAICVCQAGLRIGTQNTVTY